MNVGVRVHPLFLVLVVAVSTACQALAQGTMHRPVPQSQTTDSSGNLKRQETSPAPEKAIRGVVSLPDGPAPAELIEIYGGCGGVQNLVATADAKGRFSLDPAVLGGGNAAKNCVVRAFLEGYRSETKSAAELTGKSGQLLMQPLSSNTQGLVSGADERAGKSQRKSFERALDEAAKGQSPAAITTLEKLVATEPEYSSAWLTLGTLQWRAGDRTSAGKSYLRAIQADEKFALPLIAAAALEAFQGDWQAVLAHSQKAIDLNPDGFPSAYSLTAMANVSLAHVDAAEAAAREGLKLDTVHQYPELEYSLGVVLYSKGDLKEAASHLRAYVTQAPNGPNASTARSELAKAESAAAASPGDQSASVSHLDMPTESSPELAAVQTANASLVSKTPDHTCLETILRTEVDSQGRQRAMDPVRVDVGILDGKEIYSSPGGNRFSNESLASMLGYSFSTTGLFSAIGPALIAGNNTIASLRGDEVLNNEPVSRYDFRIVPGKAGWFLSYGNQSGEAGEDGALFVDREGLILRRVVVHAIDVPRNLKLRRLDAVIDYQAETIAGRRVLLPFLAQVDAVENSQKQHVSRMFFNHCHAYTTESTVTFAAEGAETQTSHTTQKPDLPADLEISVTSSNPITAASAAASDLINATVERAVRVRGHELIARGAAVEGHVYAREGGNALLLEFDRVETRNGWAPFYARMISTGSPDLKFGPSDTDIPGVATILLGSATGIPAGTPMLWRTESLAPSTQNGAPALNTTIQTR